MTVFDLLFAIVFLTLVGMLTLAAVSALRRRPSVSVRLLRNAGILAAVYLVVIVAVSLATPQRRLALGQPLCSDDWCLQLESIDAAGAAASRSVTATFRVFSRARRRPQRENGVQVLLLDDRGHRHACVEDAQSMPFNVLLQPGESVVVQRRFELPQGVQGRGLIVTRGRFPGLLIIGDAQSLLHKPILLSLGS